MRNFNTVLFYLVLLGLGLSACANETGYKPQRTYDPCETMSSCALSIQQAIVDNWSRPESARNHMVVVIEFTLTDNFTIKSSRVIKGSGDDDYDKSAMRAALKASPFSELSGLPNEEFKKHFSTFRLHFDPIDLQR